LICPRSSCARSPTARFTSLCRRTDGDANHFDNEASETRTLIEIETEDRLGLLYAISRHSPNWPWTSPGARIVTERGAAIDSFYVRRRNLERRLKNHRHWADFVFSSLSRFSISSAQSARSEYGLRRLEISASRASSRIVVINFHAAMAG
jgi:hypothetical protein